MKKLCAALLAACSIFGGTALSASAYTIDEVMAKAREVGVPEDTISAAYNMWAAGAVSQEELDAYYVHLESIGHVTDEMIEDMFDQMGIETTPSVTEAPSTEAPLPEDGVTETQPPTEAPTEQKAFVDMTLEEKSAYINGLTPEERDAFFAAMTPEERKSIIKQMSLEDQTLLLQQYINAAQDMHMNITVDSISEEGVALTVRDDTGTIINKAAAGVTIDPTGISHNGLLAGISGAALLSLIGFAAIDRKLKKQD